MGKWRKGFCFWLAFVLVWNVLLDPLSDCQKTVFAAEEQEQDEVIQIHDFEVQTAQDQENLLNGNVMANVTYNASKSAVATMKLYFLNDSGEELTSYQEDVELQPGENEILISFEGLEWNDPGTGEEIQISYRLEITVINEDHASSEQESGVITSSPTKEPENTPSTQPEESPDVSPEISPTVQPGDSTASPSLLPSVTPESTPTAQPSTSPAIVNEIEDEDQVMGATEITVNKETLEMGVGEKFKLKASVVSEDDVDDELYFFTYDTNKLKVTKKGKVTAINTGRASVVVEASNGFVKVVWVTVKKAPKKVTLNARTKRLKKGKTFQIKAKVPKKSANNTYTYSSSKKSVATVSKKGKVKARKRGSTVITVKTYNGKKAKMTIIVV